MERYQPVPGKAGCCLSCEFRYLNSQGNPECIQVPKTNDFLDAPELSFDTHDLIENCLSYFPEGKPLRYAD